MAPKVLGRKGGKVQTSKKEGKKGGKVQTSKKRKEAEQGSTADRKGSSSSGRLGGRTKAEQERPPNSTQTGSGRAKPPTTQVS